jgi:predicted negative regulator of RcsB-dependent stress response
MVFTLTVIFFVLLAVLGVVGYRMYKGKGMRG